MPAKRSRKPIPSRARTSRSRVVGRGGAPSSNGSRGRGRSGSPRGAAGRVEEFTRLLLEERKRLREELSEMEEHQVKAEEKPVADAAGYEEDLADVATETFEREKGLALASSVQGMLAMVEEALQKVRHGTYGVCEGCGKPIDGKRLRAIPYARLCIKCKEREERHRIAR
ncbi:MAG TPA: TraR/DksA C4-type zinc finger protein [bacterium]|nr:TraR/DksA C4-type zinc finger protein [bacterium]